MAAGLGLAVPGLAAAQQPVAPPEQDVQVTEELLERFVAVYPEVAEVSRTAQNQLAAAANTEEAHEIQMRAQDRVSALLEESDLEVAEYEAVVTRLNSDAELRAEFEQLLREQADQGGQ